MFVSGIWLLAAVFRIWRCNSTEGNLPLVKLYDQLVKLFGLAWNHYFCLYQNKALGEKNSEELFRVMEFTELYWLDRKHICVKCSRNTGSRNKLQMLFFNHAHGCG
jgi:hypothetical protein